MLAICFELLLASILGLGVAFTTYKGYLTVSIMVDTALISKREEAARILDDFNNHLHDLHHEIQLDEKYKDTTLNGHVPS